MKKAGLLGPAFRVRRGQLYSGDYRILKLANAADGNADRIAGLRKDRVVVALLDPFDRAIVDDIRSRFPTYEVELVVTNRAAIESPRCFNLNCAKKHSLKSRAPMPGGSKVNNKVWALTTAS